MKTTLFLILTLSCSAIQWHEPNVQVEFVEQSYPAGSIGVLPTGSMLPLIQHEDHLGYTKYTGQKLKKGDIVIFTRPTDGKRVVHSVVKVGSKSVMTWGINCKWSDGWIPLKNIHQIVTHIYKIKAPGAN